MEYVTELVCNLPLQKRDRLTLLWRRRLDLQRQREMAAHSAVIAELFSTRHFPVSKFGYSGGDALEESCSGGDVLDESCDEMSDSTLPLPGGRMHATEGSHWN